MGKSKPELTETEKEADRNATLFEVEEVEGPLDPELFALQIVISALQELDVTTRTRVLGYVNQRFSGAV